MSEGELALIIASVACLGALLGALSMLVAVLIFGRRFKRRGISPPTRNRRLPVRVESASGLQESTIPPSDPPRQEAIALERQGTGEAAEYRLPPHLAGHVDISGEFKDSLDRLLSEPGSYFVTGKAGTGKSTLLQLYVQNTGKRIALLAPTGLAAVNVQGETVHSFFKFPPRPLNPDDVKELRDKELFRAIDAIVIDEVSMVRVDLMDAIDRFMRLNGRNRRTPFGGVQLILFGDVLQLPPVVASGEEAEYFSSAYDGAFFFHAKVFRAMELITIELKRVFRQADPDFISVLDAFRVGQVSTRELQIINQRHNPSFKPGREDGYITLNATNAGADGINDERLKEIPHREALYLGKIDGEFRRGRLPSPLELKLKPEAQVMFVKNDTNRRWVNGTIGKMLELSESAVRVEIADRERRMVVDVGPEKWEILKHRIDRETGRIVTDVIGTYTQLPLKLAWAITIHKSQGLTFDKVIIDMGRGAFAAGQTYVALSRCRTLEGIVLTQAIRLADVKIDPSVAVFLRLPLPGITVPEPAAPATRSPERPISSQAIMSEVALSRSRKKRRVPARAGSPSGPRKCPHGVPFYYICAICEPERFKEMTGIG